MSKTEITPSRPLRVCYFGTYRAEYSRNRIQIAALRRAGVEVVECHVPLWKSIEERVEAVAGGWARPTFLLRLVSVYLQLLRRYWSMDRNFDVLVCGYPGQFDVYLAWLLTRISGKPLAWDVFMSTWLIARERGLEKRGRFAVGALYAVEWLALRLPDLLVQDTPFYVRWFEREFGVPASRFGLVPTGADSDLFQPLEDAPAHTETGKPFTVLYYGSYIPNHDAPTIVRAMAHVRERTAHLANTSQIEFVMIGDGPQRAAAEGIARDASLKNVRFVGWMDQRGLMREIAAADLCLGAFGDTPQSLMTVQNKIYECLALGKPVLTGASDAVAHALVVGEEIAVCARRDPAALADAILALRDDPELRATLGSRGRTRFERDYAIPALGERYAGYLRMVKGD